MKIKFGTEQKKIITVAELPEVKKIISEYSNQIGKFEAEIAARIASGANLEIIKFEAEISKNHRIWNQYTDESGMLDIWMEVWAFDPYYGFYQIGAYLSDIWQSTGDNADELRNRMYIRKYTENR